MPVAVRPKGLQKGQARVACTKIVVGNQDAQTLPGLQRFLQRHPVLDGLAFRDFDHQAVQGNPHASAL